LAKNNNSGIVIRPLGPIVAALAQYGQRLFNPPNSTIRNIDPAQWGSPLQPVAPLGPPGASPRGFDIWPGQNLIYTPRADAEFSALDLRELSTYPLARICIENIKDILISAPVAIQLKKKAGETKAEHVKRMKGDESILNLSRFFERPDRDHDWGEWLRLLLEDMLAIDAGCCLIRKTFSGQVVECPPLRGDSIVRYIDNNGWTPMPPDPAYAQNWWGLPYVDLTTDQLVYRPRNIVPRGTTSSQLYGMSPTEQLSTEIEIGIKRLAFVLMYYTEGSVPGVLHIVPKGTPPDTIDQAMRWMNSELSGDLAKRRQWRMIQGFNEPGKDEQIVFAKEALLSDPYDELHMRRIAFGYGVSPQRLLKQMNRASAEQADAAAELEGSRPYFVWVKSFVDTIIQRKFNLPDYEIVIDASREPDPKVQAETITMYVSKGIKTPNQAREELGDDPDPSPMANKLGIITATGFVPLELIPGGATIDEKGNITPAPLLQPNKGEENNAASSGNQPGKKGKPAAGEESGGGKVSGGNPNGKEARAEGAPEAFGFAAGAVVDVEQQLGKVSVHDTRRAVIHPGRAAPQTILARHKMERILARSRAIS